METAKLGKPSQIWKKGLMLSLGGFFRCVHIDRGAHNFFGQVAGGLLEMLLVAYHAVAVAVSGEAHVHPLRAPLRIELYCKRVTGRTLWQWHQSTWPVQFGSSVVLKTGTKFDENNSFGPSHHSMNNPANWKYTVLKFLEISLFSLRITVAALVWADR